MPLPWQSPYYASITSPRSLPGLQLWNDAADTSSLVTDTGIKLWADKSGNSSVNVLCLNGVASNSATLAAIGAIGTGNFTVVVTFQVDAFGGGTDIGLFTLGNAVGAAQLVAKTGTSRIQMSKTGTGYVSATSGSNLTAFTTYTVAYTRSGTTGTYYLNGVADGTATDNFDYTANTSVGVGANTSAVGHRTFKMRAYSTALSAAEVLADYNGTVQANCTINVDFSLAAKLATSFTATTGGTVTINTSGATGARISGARDLYQGTAANQPVLTTSAAGNYLTFNGTAHYLKAAAFSLSQPNTVYFVGSQVTWTASRTFFDGGAANTLRLYQFGLTPAILQNAGSDGGSLSTFPVATNGVISSVYDNASSSIRYNRGTAVTGTVGTGAPNGFVLGIAGSITQPANITASEVLVYSGAHDATTQDRVIRYLARKWGIKV